MGVKEIDVFLTHLAINFDVAVSTQSQAFNALIFLYKNILGQEIKEPIKAFRAKRPALVSTFF